MMTKHFLFVCSRNRLRSPTAEAVFSKYEGIAAISCGTAPDAEEQVSADLIEWADIIFVMENRHKKKLNSLFSIELRDKKIVVLGILDDYEYMDEALVELLKRKMAEYL